MQQVRLRPEAIGGLGLDRVQLAAARSTLVKFGLPGGVAATPAPQRMQCTCGTTCRPVGKRVGMTAGSADVTLAPNACDIKAGVVFGGG